MRIPSKMNLVISPKEKCFKYVDYQTNQITTYPCEIDGIETNFFEKLETALKDCFENTYLGHVGAFNLVIPDELYAFTTISLPKLNSNLSLQNLKTELGERFHNAQELDFEFYIIGETQNTNLFLVKFIRKSVMSSIHKIFANLKKDLIGINSRSNTILKNILSHEPKLKQRNFVVFDIRENVTNVIVCQRTNVLAYHQFDFGTEILSTVNVIKEESLYNHKPAQIAVIKAKAVAKAKKGIPDDVGSTEEEENIEYAKTTLTDEFEIIMENWDNFMKQIQNVLDNDFYYRNHIKFDDIILNIREDLHYVIDSSNLESDVDETGMEVKRKKKVVNTLERKQPYAKQPKLRKREFATFTKQDKKHIQLRPVDFNDLSVSKKIK